MSTIAERIKEVQTGIEEACKEAGRDPSEVTLIAVSKTKPLSMVEEAIEAGMTQFGENKVLEMTDKMDHVSKPVTWHMIGHLQTNKIKYLMNRDVLIHGVDSMHLAEALEKECEKKGHTARILLEVNVAEEDSKYGFRVDEVLPAVEKIAKFSHLKIEGLMTIAPFVEDPEENRPVFAKLRDLLLDIKERNIDNVNMSVLSMGMTNDYRVAVSEGATHVRVGTAIFGERQYQI